MKRNPLLFFPALMIIITLIGLGVYSLIDMHAPGGRFPFIESPKQILFTDNNNFHVSYYDYNPSEAEIIFPNPQGKGVSFLLTIDTSRFTFQKEVIKYIFPEDPKLPYKHILKYKVMDSKDSVLSQGQISFATPGYYKEFDRKVVESGTIYFIDKWEYISLLTCVCLLVIFISFVMYNLVKKTSLLEKHLKEIKSPETKSPVPANSKLRFSQKD